MALGEISVGRGGGRGFPASGGKRAHWTVMGRWEGKSVSGRGTGGREVDPWGWSDASEAPKTPSWSVCCSAPVLVSVWVSRT